MNEMTELQARIVDGDLAASRSLLNCIDQMLYAFVSTDLQPEGVRTRTQAIQRDCRELSSYLAGMLDERKLKS